MSQWLSQTRKLNNHYQSSTGEMRLPSWTGSPQRLDALYLGQSTYAYFAPIMYEPDAVVAENSAGELTAYIIPTRNTPVITAKMSGFGATSREAIDFYVGIYDRKTQELLNEPIKLDFQKYHFTAEMPTYGNSFTLSLNNPDIKDASADDPRTMQAQIGKWGVRVKVDRYIYYCYVCEQGSELPEVYSFMSDYPTHAPTWKSGSERITPATIAGRNNMYKAINTLLNEVTGEYLFKNIPGLCGATISYKLQEYTGSGRIALPPNGTKMLGGGNPAGKLEEFKQNKWFGAIQISCSYNRQYKDHEIIHSEDEAALYQGPTFGGISDNVARYGAATAPDYVAYGRGYGPGTLHLFGDAICDTAAADSDRYAPMGFIKDVGSAGYYPAYGVIRRLNSLRIYSGARFFENTQEY